MANPLYFEGAVSSQVELHNMPEGHTVFIATDADVTIAWWNPRTKAYGPALDTVVAPGDEVSCASYRAQIVGNASIRVVHGRP